MNISTTFSTLVFVFGAITSINATNLNSAINVEKIAQVATVDEAPTFSINGKDVCLNENFTVPVSVTDFTMITSFQFTIGWDNSLMSFDAISFISPALGSTLLFNDMSASEGILTVSWYDINVAGVSVDDLTDLFHVSFDAVAANQTSIDVTFEDTPTMKEVSGFIGNDIMLIDATYVEGEVNVDQQD